jgi:uncharacterized membrane protein YfcA
MITLPDYTAAFWITAVLAVILVGIAKAGFGGGIGVIATPLMALVMPVADAAALLLPLLIIIDMLSIRYYWGRYHRHSIKILLPFALAGIVVGALLFSTFSQNERALKIGIGLLSITFVIWRAVQKLVLGALEKRPLSDNAGRVLGGLAGFTSTLAHAGGPPVAIYLLPHQLPRDLFVGTTVLFFTVVNLVKLIPYSTLGLIQVGNLLTILILSPLCYVGVRLGLILNRRFTDIWFNRVVYTLLLLTGIQLILGQSLISLIF